jgi:hypothetical protein
MCFSAEASFAAAAALLPASVYCTTAAARQRPAYLTLAAIPFVFSLQQFAEGLVWVGLARDDGPLVSAAALAFLAVALGFWPFWAPFSVLFLERRPAARRWLAAATLLGLALGCSLYLPLALDAGRWLEVTVVRHSIRYNPRGLPAFAVAPHGWWDCAYGAVTLAPFFLGPLDRRFTSFGVLLAASLAVSLLLFVHAQLSVWCFFAALLSLQLCFAFYRLGEPCGEQSPARAPPATG